MMKLHLLPLLAALPFLVAGSPNPCVDGSNEVDFKGNGVKLCCMIESCCLDFEGAGLDDLLLNDLYSVKAVTDDTTGSAVGWLYTSTNCTGEAVYLDEAGYSDVSDHPVYQSFYGILL